MKRKRLAALFGLVALAGGTWAAAQQETIWETAALQARIDAVAARGGGRVTVPKGIHPCRTLYLKSGVELHLDEGAVILGGTRPDDYYDAIPREMVYQYGDSNTAPTVTRKALIFAEDAEDVSITGKGVIDMQGPAFFDRNTVLWGRFWAKPPWPRPRAVVLHRCRRIRMAGVTFKDCPLWTMWLRLCDGIEVDGIAIDAEQKMINSDGIDFDGCRHVRVGHSRFRTGDDCIVLRAIRHARDLSIPVVTEDVVVSNCVLNSLCQGVRIGCPSDDTIRNATFRDIVFVGRNGIVSEQPKRYLNAGDSGYLVTSNILFENWKIDCTRFPVWVCVDEGIVLRDFGHMTFRNIEIKAQFPITVKGHAQAPIRGMRFENMKGTIQGKALDVEHAPGVVLDQIDVSSL